ncbi:GMC family oxidoreductase [Veronia pacifica]|uniref:Glucose-methanol-choline oxidoreductase N-terminal domain-containing protein n=1 Tax=Veronia pacifica TaxID=1080227 RepID=A0A1C3EAH2_9GAMM|nr:GMC oxidoreductase [Veronia pacifica]ODA30251.1 hypothetical protein A8L45_20485 [Veronia pacifica]
MANKDDKDKQDTDKNKFSNSRRTFIKSSAAFASTAAITSGVNAFEKPPETGKPMPEPETGNTFDYIVVGSGPGGAPLAVRLAKAGFTVAVVEAGIVTPEDTNAYNIPAFSVKAAEDESVCWDFYPKFHDEADDHGFKYDEEKSGVLYPRAAALGGCSSHNAMISIYPEHKDWDQIENITGDSGWNHKKMWGHFGKVKEWLPISVPNLTPAALIQSATDFKLSKIVFSTLLTTASTKSIEPKSGFSTIFNIFDDDINGKATVDGEKAGCFLVPQATKNGKRYCTRDYLLSTSVKYAHLAIKTQLFVKNIIFDENSKKPKAIGVKCISGKNLYKASPRSGDTAAEGELNLMARKEVIISAGTFNSPQILQLSGIGDRNHLESLGITVVKDLPGVGQNLQDHHEISVVTEYDSPLTSVAGCTLGEGEDPCLDKYLSGSKDALYRNNGIAIVAKWRSGEPANQGSDRADLCLLGLPGNFRGYYKGYSKDFLKGDNNNLFSWLVLKGHQTTYKGWVKVTTTDPLHPPEINFQLYPDDQTGEDTLNTLLKGVKIAQSFNNKANDLDWLKLNQSRQVWPPADLNDEELKTFIKKETWGHHASCTNKIGADDDPMAVLDSKCRVRGVKNLRVVDASSFPVIPGLFVAIPIYCLSEKIAQDIIDEA